MDYLRRLQKDNARFQSVFIRLGDGPHSRHTTTLAIELVSPDRNLLEEAVFELGSAYRRKL